MGFIIYHKLFILVNIIKVEKYLDGIYCIVNMGKKILNKCKLFNNFSAVEEHMMRKEWKLGVGLNCAIILEMGPYNPKSSIVVNIRMDKKWDNGLKIK